MLRSPVNVATTTARGSSFSCCKQLIDWIKPMLSCDRQEAECWVHWAHERNSFLQKHWIDYSFTVSPLCLAMIYYDVQNACLRSYLRRLTICFNSHSSKWICRLLFQYNNSSDITQTSYYTRLCLNPREQSLCHGIKQSKPILFLLSHISSKPWFYEILCCIIR